jgi:prevent-host-death family protein
MMANMEHVTISELKNQLSAYLKKVVAGGSVLIHDRHRPIAKLERVAETDHPDGRLERLARAGLLRRGSSKLDVGTLTAPVSADASVVDALLAERRDGR